MKRPKLYGILSALLAGAAFLSVLIAQQATPPPQKSTTPTKAPGPLDGMVSLPGTRPSASTTLPAVVDVHAYPCVVYGTGGMTDNMCNVGTSVSDNTNNARIFYNDVQAFITNHQIAPPTAVFGESSVVAWDRGCSIDGAPANFDGAQWAVAGYKQSNLFTSARTLTTTVVFQPFNNLIKPDIFWKSKRVLYQPRPVVAL